MESDSPTIRQLPNGLQLKDMPEQVETTGADGHPSSSQRANPDDSIGAPETAARQMSGVQQNGDYLVSLFYKSMSSFFSVADDIECLENPL